MITQAAGKASTFSRFIMSFSPPELPHLLKSERSQRPRTYTGQHMW